MRISESGRTMVEMLAVLAIAGILTVGGMAGYRTAMRRFRANNVLELISMASFEAQKINKPVHLDDLDDVSESTVKCIQDLTAYSGGQVVIVFKNEDACAEDPNLMKASIGKCKWHSEGGLTYRYIPNRGSEIKHGVCTCDEFYKNESGSKVNGTPC